MQMYAHIDTAPTGTVRAASRGRPSCAPGTLPPPKAPIRKKPCILHSLMHTLFDLLPHATG